MPAETLRINEIFYSVQGESTWAGCPCVFVRLTGCHLRCAYCDTEYSFREGGSRSIDAVVDAVTAFPCNLVEITGGEPLLQRRVHTLMTRLCDVGKTVLIETAGACDISVCDPRVIRIMDLKTPGSGEAHRNQWANLDHLTEHDEVKFVIVDRNDYEWARDVIEKYELTRKVRAVLLSPVFEQSSGLEIAGQTGLDPRQLAEWILHEPPAGPPVRMQLQMHKFIWDPLTRGV